MLEKLHQTANAVIRDRGLCEALMYLGQMPIGVEHSIAVNVESDNKEYALSAIDLRCEFGGDSLYILLSSSDGVDDAVFYFSDALVGHAVIDEAWSQAGDGPLEPD